MAIHIESRCDFYSTIGTRRVQCD